MSCNCIEELNKSLNERLKDEKCIEKPKLKSGYTINFKNGSSTQYPVIEYIYRKRKKDGRLYEKDFFGNIIPTYCPFCGKKYIEDGEF